LTYCPWIAVPATVSSGPQGTSKEEIIVSNAFVIRYEMQPDSADVNQSLIENVFAELAEANPEGIRYASFRLADGVTFVHIGVMDDDASPLPQFAAFQEFQKGFGERVAGAPVRSDAVLVGSYGFLR
jgi:hypothetical protein